MWECIALCKTRYMTTNATSPQTSTYTPGTVVHTADAGHARIDIIAAVGGFTVTVRQGVEQVPGWTASYGTKRAAHNAFLHAKAAFGTHLSAQQIDRHRNRLAIQRATLADRHGRIRDHAARARLVAELDRIDAQLAAVEDFATAAKRPDLVETVTRHLSTAA